MRGNLAHRTDANHAEIVKAFEQLGCTVFSSHAVGGGFPDLVVGCNGRTLLVEIKTEKGELTKAQCKFIKQWEGATINIVCDTDDVVALVNRTRARTLANF